MMRVITTTLSLLMLAFLKVGDCQTFSYEIPDRIDLLTTNYLFDRDSTITRRLNDSTSLIDYTLFETIILGIPDLVIPSKKNNSEELNILGFGHFESIDESVHIKVRQKSFMPLSFLKMTIDRMSTGFYNGTIIRSEIIKANGLEIYVSDITGFWNNEKEEIGMFRYYFNHEGYSYSLLMKYPLSDAYNTMNLKERMIKSIQVVME